LASALGALAVVVRPDDSLQNGRELVHVSAERGRALLAGHQVDVLHRAPDGRPAAVVLAVERFAEATQLPLLPVLTVSRREKGHRSPPGLENKYDA
jgi:hypothetical protein